MPIRDIIEIPFQFKYLHTEYGITIDPYPFENTMETQVGSIVRYFSTKIFDVRWAARRFMRMVHRSGIPVNYYEAFYLNEGQKDSLTGTQNFSGVVAEQTFDTGRSESEPNIEIGYFSPKLIKVLQPNFKGEVTKEEKGLIYEQEAEITAPAYFLFHRWDILQIQDSKWVIINEPKIIYDNKGFVEGFSLRVRLLRPGIVGF